MAIYGCLRQHRKLDILVVRVNLLDGSNVLSQMPSSCKAGGKKIVPSSLLNGTRQKKLVHINSPQCFNRTLFP